MQNLKGYATNIWVLNNMHIFYRICRGFMRAILFHKKTLKTIEIFPTLDCNLECSMCSVQKYKSVKRRQLATDDYARLASEGAKMGAIAVNILGGEPLLADNLREIISIFKRNHYFVLVVSNATLAKKECLRELKKCGLDAICFSLDSLDDAHNEGVRGSKGYVQRVLNAADVAKKEGLIVSLAPVFFPGKVEKGLEVVKYCQEHGFGASGTQVGAVGGWEGGNMLSSDEHEKIRNMLKEYPRFTLDWALSYSLKMCCPAGKEKVAVTTFGDVVGCSINPIAFGNIRNESLLTIWRRMGKFSQYKKDSPVCLSAEDYGFIQNYLKPLNDRSEYPLYYKDHPAITSDNEKDLFEEKEIEANITAK